MPQVSMIPLFILTDIHTYIYTYPVLHDMTWHDMAWHGMTFLPAFTLSQAASAAAKLAAWLKVQRPISLEIDMEMGQCPISRPFQWRDMLRGHWIWGANCGRVYRVCVWIHSVRKNGWWGTLLMRWWNMVLMWCNHRRRMNIYTVTTENRKFMSLILAHRKWPENTSR